MPCAFLDLRDEECGRQVATWFKSHREEFAELVHPSQLEPARWLFSYLMHGRMK